MSRRSIALVVAGVLALLVLVPASRAVSEEVLRVIVTNWPKAFTIEGPVTVTGGPLRKAVQVATEGVVVPPVQPRDTSRLIDGGILNVDGFTGIVLSLNGQTKGQLGKSGEIGVILVPDEESVRQVFDERGIIQFPLELRTENLAPSTAYFSATRPGFEAAFPRYRMLFYNTTDKTVTVNLFAYLTS